MDDSNWGVIFARMLELAEKVECRTLRVYWQGGEVLCLDPESVERGLEAAADVFHGSDVAVVHRLQTNLLLYETAKWQNIISRFFFSAISSSLDFPNLYRITPLLSSEQYTQTWLKKKELAEKDGFTVSVISLPNRETLRLGAERFYRFFKEQMAMPNVQVNLPFPGWNNGLEPLPLDELARFMTDLYKVWVASGRDLNLSPFKSLENRLINNVGTLLCKWSHSCAKTLLAIGPNGDVGQCDCWVSTFREFNFGSLIEQPLDTILASGRRQLFLERPLQLIRNTKCGKCKFWKLCNGGCPVRAYAFTGDFFSPDHYCSVYYAMFSAVLENAGRHNQSPRYRDGMEEN